MSFSFMDCNNGLEISLGRVVGCKEASLKCVGPGIGCMRTCVAKCECYHWSTMHRSWKRVAEAIQRMWTILAQI